MTSLILPAWSAYAPECGRVRRLLVGFSGGVDSTVLLHLASQWSAQSGLPLLAIHVNHQLSPHASQWQRHCQMLCEQWGVPFHADMVQVINSGQGLESAARNARYEAFARVIEPDDLLLLGHHRDDQVETVFLRLLRGSGVLGLRGIEVLSDWRNVQILRPLLGTSKDELTAFARAQGWQWVEDDSNASDAFDRNFLRRQVLPLLKSRWPALCSAIPRSARHCEEAQGLLDELALGDLLPRIDEAGGLALARAGVPALSAPRQRNLIRYWLRCQGLSLPSENQLNQILDTMLSAALDAVPLVSWPGAEIRRFHDALHAISPLGDLPAVPVPFSTLSAGEYPLSTGGLLRLTGDDGLPAAASLARLVAGGVTLRFRRGGERCKLARRPTRPLKKILQDSALPPWWRDRLPLIYVDDTLAVIPGVGVCDGFQATPGEPGIRFEWMPPRLPQGWRDESL